MKKIASCKKFSRKLLHILKKNFANFATCKNFHKFFACLLQIEENSRKLGKLSVYFFAL